MPKDKPDVDSTRRTLLKTGAAVAAVAAAGRSFAQDGQEPAGTGFYERGDVRIRYNVTGAGFPLLLIAGGGLNSVFANFFNGRSPFDVIGEFGDEYQCISMDLRNAYSGQSTGPLEVDRPWDSHTDDQLGLMDHLGIDEFMVMGFCIGGPFIWNLLERAPERIRAAVIAQPVGFDPDMPDFFYEGNMSGWGQELRGAAPRHHACNGRRLRDQDVPDRRRLCLHRDARLRAQLSDAHPRAARRHAGASIRTRHGVGHARAERPGEPVPLEAARGSNTAGRAPYPVVPAGPSARDSLRRIPGGV